MNVSCPSCETVYRVDPSKITGPIVRARCKVCSHVIDVRGDQAAPEVPTAPRSVPPRHTTPKIPTAQPGAPPAKPRPAPAPAVPTATPPAAPAAARHTPPPRAARLSRPITPSWSVPSVPARPPVAPHQAPTPAAPPPVAPAVAAPVAPPPIEAPKRPSAPVFHPSAAPPAMPPAAPPAALPTAPAPRPTPAVAAKPAPEASVTQKRPINPFLNRDPKAKARRLARALVSDMIVYQPEKRQQALESGNLKEAFEEEIKKSWEEYLEQVGDELANSTSFFNDALNEILAGGQKLF